MLTPPKIDALADEVEAEAGPALAGKVREALEEAAEEVAELEAAIEGEEPEAEEASE